MTTINKDKLKSFFDNAALTKRCELATLSNNIFRHGARIKQYQNGLIPTLASLDKCKAWADANGVHFGEVTDYIEVNNG